MTLGQIDQMRAGQMQATGGDPGMPDPRALEAKVAASRQKMAQAAGQIAAGPTVRAVKPKRGMAYSARMT